MHKTLPPPLKGLITAILMVGLVLYIYSRGEAIDPGLQYFIYLIYGAGVIWTLIAYRRSPAFTGKFGSLFNQGFRCFIVVTLSMVLFTAIFSKMHPEFAEKSGEAYRLELLRQKDKTPDQVEKETADYKKQYTVRLISLSIFGYLIIGAGITAFASALLTRRK